jgi:hypothetical protein
MQCSLYNLFSVVIHPLISAKDIYSFPGVLNCSKLKKFHCGYFPLHSRDSSTTLCYVYLMYSQYICCIHSFSLLLAKILPSQFKRNSFASLLFYMLNTIVICLLCVCNTYVLDDVILCCGWKQSPTFIFATHSLCIRNGSGTGPYNIKKCQQSSLLFWNIFFI